MNTKYKLELNRSGRTYDPDMLQRAVENYTRKNVSSGRAIGEINGHGYEIRLDNVSHVIKNIEKFDGEYFCEVEFLSTPTGKLLPEILNTGNAYMGIRATGSTDIEGNTKVYDIISIDVIYKKNE